MDAIISMDLSQIKKINLCETGISADNLLRLIRSFNLTRLTYLEVCNNIFPLSFYRELAKVQFPALQTLLLNNLNIDEEGFAAIATMKFPELLRLGVTHNQLTNEMGRKLITKTIMPKLHILILGMFCTI